MTEDCQDNFKLLKISEVIALLQQRNPNEDVAVYAGCAREFTSDYGWECSSSDDSSDLQLFSRKGLN